MKRIIGLLCAACLLGGWISPETYTSNRLTPEGICRIPETSHRRQGQFDKLPEPDEYGHIDLCAADLTDLDLSGKMEALKKASFDTSTVWPAALPDGFDPAAALEQGKDPGIGVRELHARGITGKGVGIGIIDQTLLVDHQEYWERLRYYEERGKMRWFQAQMHGPAVASIALGETTGVAPDALLYYIASSHSVEGSDGEDTDNISNRAQDIDTFIALNQTLPEDEKIRVISISNGWMKGVPGAEEMEAAVARARAAGIVMVYVSDDDPMNSQFMGMGREWMADPNSYDRLSPGYWHVEDYVNGEMRTDYLLVPMDRRTVAAHNGQDAYAYYSEGGMSWVIPYVAGLYALAYQAHPGVTYEEFVAAARETAQTAVFHQNGKEHPLGKALDPAALIAALEEK